MEGQSSVKPTVAPTVGPNPVCLSRFDENHWNEMQRGLAQGVSRFETLLLHCVLKSDIPASVLRSENTLYVFATTKGNILRMDGQHADEVQNHQVFNIHASVSAVVEALGGVTKPVVISTACTSGVTAIIYASRMLSNGKFQHAVVCGSDTFSDFVSSGFNALQALSSKACRPFSKNRDGIALGEAAGVVLLTVDEKPSCEVVVSSGRLSNDSNHISAPSRTGAELSFAISESMRCSGSSWDEIGFINAHGTATLYNDEMEGKALELLGRYNIPIFSLKGALGHTLGAAGLVECIIGIMALQQKKTPPTAGYDSDPIFDSLRVSDKVQDLQAAKGFIKTSSGFGGCNAAVVIKTNH